MLLQVEITFLALAQTYKNGTSVHSVLVTPTSTNIDKASIAYDDDDPRRARVIASIESKFFRGFKVGVNTAKLQGFALITTGSEGFTQSDTSFHVDLDLIDLPSSKPSTAPSESASPSSFPSSAPTSVRNGLPGNVEVWGKDLCFSIHLFVDDCQTFANLTLRLLVHEMK